MNGADARSVILPFSVAGRSLRLHLFGDPSRLDSAQRALEAIATEATDESEFLTLAGALLIEMNVTLADVLDVMVATPDVDLVREIRVIARSTSPDRALGLLEYAFAGATEEQLQSLATSRELPWIRQYVQSLLDQFDEERSIAEHRLANVLDPPLDYLLVR